MNAPPTGLFARPTRVPIWRFALRDLRGGLNGLRIFLLCIALGVAAIVGVESLAQALNDGLGREGRVILGGDASFSLIHRRLSADEQRFLESHGSLSTIATVRGMARAASGDAALIEIKAVEPSWPRLGAAVFAPPMSLKDALGEKDGVFGAAVEEALTGSPQLEARRRHSHRRSEFRPSHRPRQRTRSAGDRDWAWAARAHVASRS